MRIGYARVSTLAQNLDRQIAALNAERCDRVHQEKASGKATHNRPELDAAISALAPGDVLVIAEWDRATRSMMDGITIIERIARMGATVKVLDKPWLDLTTPIGKGFLAFLSALAEDERLRILSRASEGRSAARIRGVRFGPKPKLNPEQRERALARLAAGETCRAIAADFRVHHATIARLVPRS
ncbi:MAG: recombinase family protein [Hyphomicrobiaceae bacterium]